MYPDCRRRPLVGRAGAAAPGQGPPDHCAGPLPCHPPPFLSRHRSAPLRVVVDVHCPAKPAVFACDFGRLEPRLGSSLLVPRGRGRGPLRFRTTTCWRPCWLSVGAHGRMATGSVRHAESGLRSIEVPYCLRRLLLCPFGTRFGLVFSGRPAGRPVYAPLRERAAPPPGDLPGTRPAPRRSAFRAPRAWLGSSAPSPRPPWRWPPSLRYASARRRRRGLPGSRPAPRRSACRARGPG
jgi:hypothetical protein